MFAAYAMCVHACELESSGAGAAREKSGAGSATTLLQYKHKHRKIFMKLDSQIDD